MRYEPDYTVVPGETLGERLIELGMDQRELAMRLEISTKCVSQIINGKAPITHKTAIGLERVTGVPSHVWNNLEMNYRAALASIADQDQQISKADHDWLRRIPTAELVRRGAIDCPSNKDAIFKAVLEFFGVVSRQAWNALWAEYREAATWRRSSCFESHPGPTATWLRLGELEAQRIRCALFDKAVFQKALVEIRKLTVSDLKECQPELVRLCSQAGVAVVFVPSIRGCPASGVTRWLTPDKALIQLSLRYKSDDHFWFSFFHEAGHILHDPKKLITIDEPSQDYDEVEARANSFAANHLIPAAQEEAMRQCRTEQSIKSFAKRIGIAPGIVVGRLQHDGQIRRNQFNHLKRRFQMEATNAG